MALAKWIKKTLIKTGMLCCAFAVLPVVASCQHAAVEAIYYTPQHQPYKIERRYNNPEDSSVFYVYICNEVVFGIRQKKTFHNDTAVLTEEYCTFIDPHPGIKDIPDSYFSKQESISGDTSITSYYSWDDTVIYRDTTLIGKRSRNNEKRSALYSILHKKTDIRFDSIQINETVRSYYVNDFLVKAEWLNKQSKCYEIQIISYLNSNSAAITYCKPGGAPYNGIFHGDTVTWNNDSTEIRWISLIYDNTISTIKYRITGLKKQAYLHDTRYYQIDYLDPLCIFKNIFLSRSIYADTYSSIELRNFDREKYRCILDDSKMTVFKYRFDRKHRIISQQEYCDNVLIKTVSYSYH